jgi:hypothetical protein
MCGGALFEGLARRIKQRSASPDIRSQGGDRIEPPVGGRPMSGNKSGINGP